MNYTVMSLLVLACIFFNWTLRKSITGRIFINVLTLSTIYFGVLGPWYWLKYQLGWFLGVNWATEIRSVPWLFLAVYLLASGSFILIVRGSKLFASSFDAFMPEQCGPHRTKLLYSILAVGFSGCLYVLLRGASAANAGSLEGDSLLLIFYQLSDLPIAAFLFIIGARRLNRAWVSLLLLYLVYSVVVGFRYRIALLLGPVLIYAYYFPWKQPALVRLGLVSAGVAAVALFSAMTIARSKFAGLDLSALARADASEFLYGVFAETNIIFGLLSAIHTFGVRYDFVGWQPIYEIFVQYIPRFLYPSKDLYQHLHAVLIGLGNNAEASSSGTAMPFFGEFYSMAGWFGLLAGVIAYSAVSAALLALTVKHGKADSQRLMAAAFVAILMAYYYFSRGSMAQVSKGLLFMYLPYLLLLSNKRFVFSRRGSN